MRFLLAFSALVYGAVLLADGYPAGHPRVWITILSAIVVFLPFPGAILTLAIRFRDGITRLFLPLLLLVALSAGALYFWMWGDLGKDFQPVVHDEFAYLFQAKTFLAGRLSYPSPPEREFFDAFHILTEPVFAAKYPPGHALFLLPGEAAGHPWIGPLIASILSLLLAGLLLRPVAGSAGALLVTSLFAVAPAQLQVATTYLSQTSFLFGALLTLFLLKQAWIRNGVAWAAGAGVTFGWIWNTRPLNAMIFGASIALFLLIRYGLRALINRKKAILGFAIPFLVAMALGLAYNQALTGSLLQTPWQLYSDQYHPEDAIGFYRGEPVTPTEAGPGKRIWIDRFFYPNWEKFTPQFALHTLFSFRIPMTYVESAPTLLLVFLGGTLLRTRRRRVAASIFPLYLLSNMAYVCYWSPWVRYYHEVALVIVALAVLGAGAMAECAFRQKRAGAFLAVMGLIALTVWEANDRLEFQFNFRRIKGEFHSKFERKIEHRVPNGSLVFVSYSRWHNPDLDLLNNEPDLETADRIFVHDLGPNRNQAFHRAHYPGRRPYYYEELSRSILEGYALTERP